MRPKSPLSIALPDLTPPTEVAPGPPAPEPPPAIGPAPPLLAAEGTLPLPSLPAPPAIAETYMAAEAPAPPQVTITIERIDIAMAPQPPSPAPSRPPIERSSGFAAYARARRGIPR